LDAGERGCWGEGVFQVPGFVREKRFWGGGSLPDALASRMAGFWVSGSRGERGTLSRGSSEGRRQGVTSPYRATTFSPCSPFDAVAASSATASSPAPTHTPTVARSRRGISRIHPPSQSSVAGWPRDTTPGLSWGYFNSQFLKIISTFDDSCLQNWANGSKNG